MTKTQELQQLLLEMRREVASNEHYFYVLHGYEEEWDADDAYNLERVTKSQERLNAHIDKMQNILNDYTSF